MREAQAGRHVVFLVPGDVDAGCEEQSLLGAQGFAVEVVPGIAVGPSKEFPFMSRDDIATEILRAAS
jgi:hypothetical protein